MNMFSHPQLSGKFLKGKKFFSDFFEFWRALYLTNTSAFRNFHTLLSSHTVSSLAQESYSSTEKILATFIFLKGYLESDLFCHPSFPPLSPNHIHTQG